MIRTQIQLTEQQAHTLKELAHRENASIAELARRAIDYWLEAAATAPSAAARQRALAVAGRFRSDTSDGSERHDDYLAEAYSAWSSS